MEKQHMLRHLTDAMCAHDAGHPELIHHFLKVHAFARQIALAEGMAEEPLFVLESAALTHDIGILPAMRLYGRSSGPLQEELGPLDAKDMLERLGYTEAQVERICFLIAHHHTVRNVDALDWRILLEADYLVNMIENDCSDEAIDQTLHSLFQTEEGKKLLAWVRPCITEMGKE